MNRFRTLLVCSLLLIAATSLLAADTPKAPSLYTRLGGYDAIAAVTDDFIARLAADKQLSRFFAGHSQDSLMKIRQHVVEFLCNATGGPCVYMGRDMKVSHKGMGITESDWDLSVKALTATLDKFKVPEKEKGEVLAAVGPLKAQIVEKQ
ncbi:MAG TPA: group 1 truncated hemoglobin [Thermoanaerobaculia bacterium]|nr:group 1 truncated hemoglobin [Thermoanaerobaculia bacterium]